MSDSVALDNESVRDTLNVSDSEGKLDKLGVTLSLTVLDTLNEGDSEAV